MKFRKLATAMALVTGVTAASVGVIASPAYAASSSCSAPYWYSGTRTCNTGAVSANSAHTLSVSVQGCPGAPWKVYDTSNNVTVASGTGNGDRVITGLYGTYKARLLDACWLDKIKIFN